MTRDELELIEEALLDWDKDLRRQGIRSMGTRQATLTDALACVGREKAKRFAVGDQVAWRDGCGNNGTGTIERIADGRAWLVGDPDSHGVHRLKLLSAANDPRGVWSGG